MRRRDRPAPSSMCSTLYACCRSRQICSAVSRGSSIRSNGSFALMIFFISASMAGKSSSDKRVVQVEVVVEAPFDRRAEGQLDPLAQPHHGAGHHVGTRMPHDGQRLGVFLGQQPQLDFARRRGVDSRGRQRHRRLERPGRLWRVPGRFPRQCRQGLSDSLYCFTVPSGRLTFSMGTLESWRVLPRGSASIQRTTAVHPGGA